MEPLFTTQTDITFEEFKKLNQKLFLGRIIVRYVFVSLIMLIVTIMGVLSTRNLSLMLFFPLWLILLLVLKPITQKAALKKAFNSNKAMRKIGSVTYDFFSDHLEMKTENSFSSVEYGDILKIIETKTNFYIMLSSNQACNIIKSNCSPELIEFINNLNQKKDSN